MKNKTILLIGGNGFLGQKLIDTVPKNYTIHSIDISKNTADASHATHYTIDVCNVTELLNAVTKIMPDVIIYLAKSPKWNADNSIFTKLFTSFVCSNVVQKTQVIYFSTDSIFDGTHGMYKENDIPHPINSYGKWKLCAEEILKNYHPKAIIVRTSYLYGQTSLGLDHRTKNILDNIYEGQEIARFYDMYRSVTLIDDVALVTWKLCDYSFTGIIHIAGPRMNLVQFYRNLVTACEKEPLLIKEQSFHDIDNAFAADTSLDTSYAQKLISFQPTHPLHVTCLKKNYNLSKI